MHICVVGGGLAGSLLAWRLARRPGVEVELLLGRHGRQDATSASGGAVRAYEAAADQRELAIASMRELLDSEVLRRWADYRPTGSAYLHTAEGDLDLPGAVAEIERSLPGSAHVVGSGTLDWFGGLPERVAVVEREAGHLSPGLLRNAVVSDLEGLPRATVRAVAPERPPIDGPYDIVVLATGSWTPGLLRAGGFAAADYRTKSIQYTIYELDGRCPPPFFDEVTGLYAKPTAEGGLLLGVPTDEWDVVPGRSPVTPAWHDTAVKLVAEVLPGVRLGQAQVRMSAADCYCEPPVLALRTVAGVPPGLLTFTGGSGGSAKTALAASRRAADQITGGVSG